MFFVFRFWFKGSKYYLKASKAMHINKRELLLACTSSLICLIGYKTFRIYLNRKKFKHIPGPPTKGILGFYLGNLDEIVRTMKSGRILADLTNDW